MPRKSFGFEGKISADSDEIFLILLIIKPAHSNHYYNSQLHYHLG